MTPADLDTRMAKMSWEQLKRRIDFAAGVCTTHAYPMDECRAIVGRLRKTAAELTYAQRRDLVTAASENGLHPHEGSEWRCAYNLVSKGLVEEKTGYGSFYATNLGRAVADVGGRPWISWTP